MRNLQKTLAFVGLLVTSGIGQLMGCSNDATNCDLNYETCGSVGPVPGCTDSPSQNAEVIRSECAYFVGGAKKSDTNTGGEADPFATLEAALSAAKANKARVYLCGSVAERVEIPANVSVFGGFDCSAAEWKYDATKRGSIAPAAPAIDAAFQSSVRITSGTINIEDVDINAANAEIPGGSSIAVIVDAATVNFVRVNLTAGDGKEGAAGTTPTDDVGPDKPDNVAIAGNTGQDACMGGPGGNPGAAAATNALCPESIGGKGGNGQESTGDNGDNGSPTDATFGQGGPGEGANQCMPGGVGRNGTTGTSGMGATIPGTIDIMGYSGNAGEGGVKGTTAQGGGGGGGAKGKTSYYGASGGGGGAGGCPGNGGGGGSAGGSSIGIVNLNGTMSFDTVKITTSAGAQGGAGGDGQIGGAGGAGGSRGLGAKCGGTGTITSNACKGGDGGNGGQGGQGGGGFGGHSIGIAYKKGATVPNTMGADIQPGTAGAGGLGADTAGNGGDGIKDNTHEFN